MGGVPPRTPIETWAAGEHPLTWLRKCGLMRNVAGTMCMTSWTPGPPVVRNCGRSQRAAELEPKSASLEEHSVQVLERSSVTGRGRGGVLVDSDENRVAGGSVGVGGDWAGG